MFGESIFGGLWSFESNQDKADSAYTRMSLDLTQIQPTAMMLGVYNCCFAVITKPPGGEFIMVDGYKIAQKIKLHRKDLYKILCDMEVKGQYIGDGVFLRGKQTYF